MQLCGAEGKLTKTRRGSVEIIGSFHSILKNT